MNTHKSCSDNQGEQGKMRDVEVLEKAGEN